MNALWDLNESREAALRHEHALAAILYKHQLGFIADHTAIRQLRERGLTEPEIEELIE
jgi:hypothetical protein